MAYTTHGYLIPGTPEGAIPPPKARCGGLGLCKKCRDEAKIWMGRDADLDHTLKARQLVVQFVDERFLESHPDEPMPSYEAIIVEFSQTLGHWKALVDTTISDSIIYEVVCDGNKDSIQITAYKKIDQKIFRY